MLTTTDCLTSLPALKVTRVSGNVGVPAYFFTIRGYRPRHPFNAVNRDEPTTIGMLLSAKSKFQIPVQRALSAVGVQSQIVAKSDEFADLKTKLQSRAWDYICVIDDGTGTAWAQLKQLETSDFAFELVPPPGLASDEVGILGTDGVGLSVQLQFVDSPWTPALRSAVDATAIVFPTKPTRPTERPAARLSSVLSWPTVHAASADSRDDRPLPGVVPVLVTVGAVSEEVSRAVQRALLAAPIDALINPCEPAQQDMYRSFLRGALSLAWRDRGAAAPADINAVQLALWEHAALLDSRGEADKYYHQQRDYAEAKVSSLFQDFERDLMSQPAADSCPAPKRWFFLTDRFANYQFGVKRLRDALASTPAPRASAAMKDATACLRLAWKEAPKPTPTCGEKQSGMWTTYYAPYIAAAVIASENRNAPR